MECAVVLVTEECGELAGQNAVLVPEMVVGGGRVELDDGQLPTDNSFGRRYADFPS